MFNFRFFPGVDFTKINLDWIMRKIGVLEQGQSAVEEAAEQASAAAEQATAAAETATAAAESAIEQIETVVDTANEAKQIAQTANTNAGTALTTAQGVDAKATTALTNANAALGQADLAREEAQNALEHGINFTVFGSVTNNADWVLKNGIVHDAGEIRYAISDNRKFLKIYGWERFRVTGSSAGAGALYTVASNILPLDPPESNTAISGCGLQISHSVLDSSDVSGWKKVPNHVPYINAYASGAVTIEMDSVDQPYVTFMMYGCIYQISDFGDTPTP